MSLPYSGINGVEVFPFDEWVTTFLLCAGRRQSSAKQLSGPDVDAAGP
jgi:hypothetical protein